MSKHETWRTREYWDSVGGLLIEEFLVQKGGNEISKRRLDGLIILGEEKRIQLGGIFDIKGKDVICVQTKSGRLGMYVMGQAFFSRDLLLKFEPKSIKSIIIIGKNDTILNELCARYNLEVIVMPDK